MYGRDRDQDTICAVSTPHGVGGISVIRISGPHTLEVTRRMALFLPAICESHRAYYGILKNPEINEAIDEVLITYFQQGKSFTGEEVVEISCHGSPFICQRILNVLVGLGIRPADRGEFTYRAFLNSKLDLVQAESVLSLIESQTQQSSRLALRQLKGDLSQSLEKVEDDMTWILAHAEAGIDFSEQDIKVVENSEVLKRLDRVEKALELLVASFRVGRILKDGFRVVLTGVPNVGKSSLLNLFLEDNRAIVTDIPGTTRDVINGDTSFEGYKFTFLDTAGLRSGALDVVEKMGIERSYQARDEADRVLFIFDAEIGLTLEDIAILDELEPEKTLILCNKSDKIPPISTLIPYKKGLENSKFYQKLEASGIAFERKFFLVSALDKTSRQLVFKELIFDFGDLQIENTVLLSNSRHFENLSHALENTTRSKALVLQGMGDEFLAIELKEALIAIHETLGKRFDDQIMDRVFKEFCIGK